MTGFDESKLHPPVEPTNEEAPDEDLNAEYVIIVVKAADGNLHVDTTKKDGCVRPAYPADVIQVAAMMNANAQASIVVSNVNKAIDGMGQQIARMVLNVKGGPGGTNLA